MATIVKTNFDMGESIILWKENILPDSIHDELIESFKELTWFGGDYEGREVSRKQRWYHIDGSYFCDKWPIFDRWVSNPYTEILLKAQAYVQDYVKNVLNIDVDINSVLVNYYENGKIIIPKHRDNENIFGDNPTVIVVSLGSTRTLRFSRVDPTVSSLKVIGDTIDIDVKPKSILIMKGTTQKYYCHEIIPSTSELPRYSMTFRNHVPIV